MSDLTEEKQDMTLEDAIEIYHDWFGDDSRVLYKQPSQSSSFYSRGVWYLGNINGLLAKVGSRSRKVFWPPAGEDAGNKF